MIGSDAEPTKNGTTIKQMYISNKNGELVMHARKEFISPLKFTSSVWLKVKDLLTDMLTKEKLIDIDNEAIFSIYLENVSQVSMDHSNIDDTLKVKQTMNVSMDKKYFKSPEQARRFSSIVMTQVMRLIGVDDKAIENIYKK